MAKSSHISLLGQNIMLVGFGNGVSKILMFIANIWIANHLLDKGYGTVSAAFAVVNYLSLVAFSGIDTVTTREAAGCDSHQLRGLSAQLFLLRLVVCFLLIVLLFAAGYLIPGTLGTLLILYALSFVPQVFYTVNLYYGIEWSWPVMLYFIGGRIVYVLLLCLYVKSSRDITYVPLAFGAAILAENTFLLILWIKRMGKGMLKSCGKLQLARWKPAWPVTCSGAFLLLHENAAIVMLFVFLGSAATGIYSASYRLVYIAISLTTLLSYVFLARLTKARREHPQHASHLFRTVCITAGLAGLVAGIVGCMLADPVIRLIYVDAFLPSAGLLTIAVWQMVLAPIRILSFQTINACHQQTRALPYIAVGSVGSVMLIASGIWFWQLKGAVIGTITGEAVLTVLLFILAKNGLTRTDTDTRRTADAEDSVIFS